MFDWTEDECLQLIELYKSKALLWDPQHPNYFKKNLKEESWREIACALGSDRSDVDCKNKIVSLLSSHRREKNKTKQSQSSRKGSSKVYVSRWFAYEALQFLNDRDHSRKRQNSETLVETISDDRNVKEEDEDDDEDAETSDGASNNPQTYSSPAPKQRKTGRQQDSASSAVMTSALTMIRPVASSLSNEPAPETDEMTAFFNYVTQKTKNYPPATKIGVQHAIFEILMQADRGFYEGN